MSDSGPDQEYTQQEEAGHVSALTRFELTGRRLTLWTERARSWLASLFVFSAKAIGDAKLPDDSENVGEKAKRLTITVVDSLEENARKTSVDNELKVAQKQKCEAEAKEAFAAAELRELELEKVRIDIERSREEVKSLQLRNIEKQLELQQQLHDCTEGKTGIHTYINESGVPVFLFADLPDTEQTHIEEPVPIDKLGFSSKLARALSAAGIKNIDDLCHQSPKQLMKINGVGKKSVEAIALRLSELGRQLSS